MAVEELTMPGVAMDYEIYAAEAQRLVQYDDDSHLTIGDVPVEQRMHSGVFEEWSEIFGGDYAATEHTAGYSRINALHGGARYTEFFRNSPEGLEQITLHTKEFGDNLWYVTNYLGLFGISLEDAMHDVDDAFESNHSYDVSVLERDVDLSPYPPELAGFVACGRALFSHMGVIFNRAGSDLTLDDQSAYVLKQIARQYIDSMRVLVAATFNITLEEVMAANLQKINGRWENGTVLGYGDTR